MRTVSAQWAITVTQSHKRWARASTFYGGTKTGEPPLVDGSVTFDASAPGARRCQIVVPIIDSDGTDWSPGTDRTAPLAPNGQRLLIESGVIHPDQTIEYVSLGWYLITESVVDETAGTVTVTGSDLWTLLESVPILRNSRSMRIPFNKLATTSLSAMSTLLYPRLTDDPFPSDPNWPTETMILPNGGSEVAPKIIDASHGMQLLQGDSRTGALQQLFQQWPGTGRVDDDGELRVYTVAEPPTSDDPVDLELTDANGTNPVVVTRQFHSERDKVYNCVVVNARSASTGEDQFKTELQYISGVLSTFGPMGYRPRLIETTLVSTQAACDAIAYSQLARSVMYALTESIQTVPNAALELDDVVLVDTAASGTFKGRVTQIQLPLLSTGPMTLTVSNQEAADTFASLRSTHDTLQTVTEE